MKLIILGDAEREFAESVAYYEAKQSDLGRRFRWIEQSLARVNLAAQSHLFSIARGAADPPPATLDAVQCSIL